MRRTLNQTAWAIVADPGELLPGAVPAAGQTSGREKRAAMAVAHGQLGVVYHVLKRGTAFADLGVDYFDRGDEGRLKRQLIAKLERLGCKVTVEAADA